MKVLLTHPGTQYSYNLARQLNEHSQLCRFHTCVAYGFDSWQYKISKLFPKFIQKKINNRIVWGVNDKLIRRHEDIEIKTWLLTNKQGMSEETLFVRNEAFQKAIPDSEIKKVDVVIGFDTSSWILAKRCKELGKRFILDVSIAHPLSKNKVYKLLERKFPKWSPEIQPKKNELIAKEIVETNLADIVVVPSTFVKNTYIENGVDENKIVVNSFGTSIEEFNYNPDKPKGKCTFFFLGGLTARKGLPFLLETWSQCDFPNAELIIAGFGALPSGFQLPLNVSNLGRLDKEKRGRIFDMAHVFVFPSFFEGLAQVQIEAMASGLPVIGTTNSGAEDLVDEGINGFIIEPGNFEQLKSAMTFFVQNPNQIPIMSLEARKKAEQFTWDAYGERWVNILNSLC